MTTTPGIPANSAKLTVIIGGVAASTSCVEGDKVRIGLVSISNPSPQVSLAGVISTFRRVLGKCSLRYNARLDLSLSAYCECEVARLYSRGYYLYVIHVTSWNKTALSL